jgi:hypothetical protein
MSINIVGSKMPALASDALKPSKAGYGQNGFAGASSDLPNERTISGFLPDTDSGKLADANAWTDKIMKRPVKTDSIPPAFGMTQRTPRNK